MRLIDADAVITALCPHDDDYDNPCISPHNAELVIEQLMLDTVYDIEQISDEVNKLKKVSDGNNVYVGINDVFNIIDKYRGDKE